MAEIIQIKNNPNHKIFQSLNDVIYQFIFKYNSKKDFWSFDIYTESGDLIIAGVKIVANYRLLFQYKIKNIPDGDIIAQSSDKNERIGRDSFSSNKCQLIFIPKNELSTI